MPQYGSTILLLFILFSCVYKKHIRDWWWFRFGAISFVVSVVLVGLSYGISVFSRAFATSPALVLVKLLSNLALIGALAGLVMACIKYAEDESEYLRCLKCGHILKGLSEPRCPECGQKI